MITKKMNGDIQLISSVGKGTAVKFFFETKFIPFKEFDDTDICLSEREAEVVANNSFKFF